MYVTLANEVGEILWVSATLPSLTVDDVVGKPLWHFASQETSAEIRRSLKQTLRGEPVDQLLSVPLRGRIHHFRSVWQRVDIESGLLVVIRTVELQPEFLRLSDRQREILRCVVDCRSDREAAEKLQLSERTVETHLRNIREILGVRTRQALVAISLHHFMEM